MKVHMRVLLHVFLTLAVHGDQDYYWQKSPFCPLNSRTGGPHSENEYFAENIKYLAPARNQSPIPQVSNP
jgi:hypothetical protein